MEVSVGTLDSRLRLAPCSRVEPYLPAGSRLWGAPGWVCAAWRQFRMEYVPARHHQGLGPGLRAHGQHRPRRGADGQ